MSRIRKAVVVALTTSLMSVAVPAAHATIFTGACAVSVTFTFGSPVTTTPKPVDYSVSVGNARTANLRTPGCAVDTSPLSPLRTTDGGGVGSSPAFSCEAGAGLGSWEQSWTPDPPAMSGSHTVSGTWGNWQMVVVSPALNFTGEMDLTVDPADATKIANCAVTGITSLKMIGVMHFQDPSL